MAKLLFNLRGVPEDEAKAVRALLTENQIGYYETTAGNWGISLAALWLEDQNQLAEANRLLEEYEREQLVVARAEYERLKEAGELPGLLENIRDNWLLVVLLLGGVGALVYLPFRMFG